MASTNTEVAALLREYAELLGLAGDAEHAPVLDEDLIRVTDLRGDLHTHTDLTDGIVSLEGMIASAESRGYAYYAVTDHAPNLVMQYSFHRVGWTGAFRVWQVSTATRAGLVSHTREPVEEMSPVRLEGDPLHPERSQGMRMSRVHDGNARRNHEEAGQASRCRDRPGLSRLRLAPCSRSRGGGTMPAIAECEPGGVLQHG